jgi:sulfide:quinone oxidoreductase
MARVVIMGAGVAGHTAALHAKRLLGKKNEIIVVAPNSKYNWIPSNIWVGVGKMNENQVTFPLAPIYKRKKIEFHQALAQKIYPEGDSNSTSPFIEISYTDNEKSGQIGRIKYDFLINATGPKLNFAATPGLGPDGHSVSVCTYGHANEAAKALEEVIQKLKQGERQTLAVGVGHGTCTCEGAAFEYTFNVDHELRKAGVRDLADLYYITNEFELGDFGVGGMTFTQQGFQTTSKLWTESLFRERNVKAITGVHVSEVKKDEIFYENVEGQVGSLNFDFAMLLPPFRGVDLKAFDKSGTEISEEIFAPNGFMKVDSDYTVKPFEEWRAEDWPKTYKNPIYPNIYAVGIAFAPPPSGIMGKTAILSIREILINGENAQLPTASMSDMGAACVASAGNGLLHGSAASMTMYPVVPDYIKYPTTGRSAPDTFGEIGLAGHWIKLLLHYMFIYKAKARFGWFLIPE